MRDVRGPHFLFSFLILTSLFISQTCYAGLVDSASAASNGSSASPGPRKPELRGDIYMAHQSYVAAIRAYQQESDRSAVLMNKLGVAYHHLSAFDQARKYYKQALGLNPNFPQAINNLAAIYYTECDFGKAEHMFKQALMFEPQAVTVLVNLGSVYFAEHKYKQGTEVYEKALLLNPNALHPDPRAAVGMGPSRNRDLASYYHLAKLLAANGKFDDAVEYLRKAMDVGLLHRQQLMKDKQLTSLVNTSAFQKLMAEEGETQ